ncbi:LysR family transcriptional regulator [Fulvimonas soli]|uniref:DNA-binding transcriptional LysR family regulator n=1 Tax=Fulvimonas soli TaxID=155197 RepID=A0A316IN91_9GAMM|nr:LysR family transcriptional regulator [Fulvimonas soli]PWK91968.1 DNA-binding transcriptional LysR family regulator [Fulvimonas soli]TNY27418.1 transcriptional regulator [Fulvimonas soli]
MGGEVNLNRLAVFAAVVRAGSFTAAAAQLGLTKAMVSQHLARLERELGATLLVRSTRRMALTEAGAAFHEDCVRILAEAQAAIERVGAGRELPRGTLRLTAPANYGAMVIAPALAGFLRLHPQLRADLVLDDQLRDLIGERFDLAIRGGPLRDSGLHAVRLDGFQQWLVAAPAYLDARGAPRRPQDLAEHDAIALTALSSPTRWSLADRRGARHAARLRPRAQADSAAAVHAMALAGAGLAVLPDFMVEADLDAGRLRRLLPAYRLPEGSFHAVYPGQRPPAKVRAFIDHLRAALAAR